jgi:hypothetical protein
MLELSPELIERLRLKKEEIERDSILDASRPRSRPHAKQQELIELVREWKYRHYWIVAGNRCLAKGTLVATPSGPVPIEDLRVGDTVYDEHSKEIEVLQTFYNGKKPVVDLVSRGKKVWATCTKDHTWLTEEYTRETRGPQHLVQRTTDQLGVTTKQSWNVARRYTDSSLGSVDEPAAYLIGAMLGDGCCTCNNTNSMCFSSSDEDIVARLAQDIHGTYTKNKGKNYTWHIHADKRTWPSLYKLWCGGRLAHEKYVDISIIKTWNRTSLLNFVAGVLDTDGSVTKGSDGPFIRIGMQAKSVIDALEYAFLALWQIPTTRSIDARPKYKNGNIHSVTIRNPWDIRSCLRELQPYQSNKDRMWKDELLVNCGNRSCPSNVKLTMIDRKELVETYDIHVDSPTNLYLLANGLVTHNSGKSSVVARIYAWILQDRFKDWKRPKDWDGKKLTLLLVGQTRQTIEEELWENKIKPLLPEGCMKEKRKNGVLIMAVHKTTGHRIMFYSMDNPTQGRRRIQGVTGHVAWIDEMPESAPLVEETQKRVSVDRGLFFATFTPKVACAKIRNLADKVDPALGIKFQMGMFDNPLFANDPELQAQELKSLEGHTLEYRNAVLYGSWMTDDLHIFNLRPGIDIRPLPDHYSPTGWRHVEGADPAISSAHGHMLYAQDPVTKAWWIVVAKYMRGHQRYSDLAKMLQYETSSYKIVKRVCDPAGIAYRAEAEVIGLEYSIPFHKVARKEKMLQQLNEHFGTDLFVADHCEEFIDECSRYKRSSTDPTKIMQAKKFHLIDAAKYTFDELPAEDVLDRSYTAEEIIKNTLNNWTLYKEAKAAERTLGKRKQRRTLARRN